MSHFCLRAFGLRTFTVRPPGVARSASPQATLGARSGAAKTKTNHPLAVADATTDTRQGEAIRATPGGRLVKCLIASREKLTSTHRNYFFFGSGSFSFSLVTMPGLAFHIFTVLPSATFHTATLPS